ncbi:MAG: glycosyltransferase [Candidatus Lokiarchaeota archaeon]|nr:glycosyltransferase [Candidatus Lokiarchaeota archaeon]MBD3199998.1 glycosyltransferase [Candidatus Lokiarchaeota archaeon]
MSKIKILVFSPLSLEYGRGGEISSMELAEGLNKDYDVLFMDTNIIPGKQSLSKESLRKRKKKINYRGKLKFATMKIGGLIFSFPYPISLLKFLKYIKDVNVIYYSFSTFKMNLIFMFFNILKRNKKFIIGYRKPLYSEKIFSLYNLKYRLSILFLSKFSKNVYHHALSEHAKKFLLNFYKSNRLFHITHGIDIKNFSLVGNRKLKSDHNLNFCYIGYLDDLHKGVGILLKGIDLFLKKNNLEDVKFEFIGKGPLEEKLAQLAEKYGETIKFHGYIDNQYIAKYYQRNDVFLFTSRREPFPRSIMEALASELIILSTKTIGSIELLKNKEFGIFIDSLDPVEIENKLLEIYHFWKNDFVKFTKIQILSKKYISEKYSIQNEILGFKDLLNTIFKY